jgi:hypothetical protein
MTGCWAWGTFSRRASAAFAAVLILSACGGASGTTASQSAAARVTVTATVTATASPSSSATSPASSGSPGDLSSSAGEASYYLADFNPVQGHGVNVDSSPHTVNGVTYDHPVSWSPGFGGDPYWEEWDLSRQCTWLISPGVGLEDNAPSDAAAIFSVQADGAYKWQKTIHLGQSYSLKVSVKGALRLRLTVKDVQDSTGMSYATWGDAQVLCSAQPPNSTNGNS